MKIYKTFDIDASHRLEHLNYKSPCSSFHGHRFKIEIWIEGELDRNDMVFDFSKIKKLIHGKLDHKHINEIIKRPTAENLVEWIARQIKRYDVDNGYEVIKKITVRVWETPNGYAEEEYD